MNERLKMQLPIDIESVKGFMDAGEGAALYTAAREESPRGPVLEVGTYCGKSAVYLGTACKEVGGVLFAVDHHRGSEENQPGWEHHDPETWDADANAMDTLPFLRRTLRVANLEDVVIPIVGKSATVAANWGTPLAMLFIDGGHSREMAFTDYNSWNGKVMPGGLMAIHDVFPNPEDGGRPPYEVYCAALESGTWREECAVKSLRFLRRV